MSTTVSSIQTLTNQYIRDTSTNSVSAADRLAAITESARSLYNDFEFDFSNRTYAFNYYDTVSEYVLTTDVPDIMVPVDLRRDEGDRTEHFTLRDPREVVEMVDNGSTEPAYAIEQKNRGNYLIVNHTSKYGAKTIHSCDSTTSDGTWTLDATNGDGTNLTADVYEYKEGSASLNFDADVSQSGNNKVILYNETLASSDLTEYENTASFLFWVYLPTVTNFSSIKLWWGSSSAATWSATVTTDFFGEAFVAGWNLIKVDWNDASLTGSPDVTAVDYIQVDFNYAAGFADATDFRLDDIRLVKPEELTLHYQSLYLGLSGTTYLSTFGATTDVPFYSGIYDAFDNLVAHRAAALLFRQMGLGDDAQVEEALAARELRSLKIKFPSSGKKPVKNFKVAGLSW